VDTQAEFPLWLAITRVIKVVESEVITATRGALSTTAIRAA